MENALASHNAESRSRTRERLSALLPDTTKIFIESHFNNPESYDLFVEIVDGRIDGASRTEPDEGDTSARRDLNWKLQAIAKAELFAKIDRKNQRLLAFSAQWYKAKPGQIIFAKDQAPDAAYLCVRGKAALFWPERNIRAEPITEINPGRLIGDLAVIMNEPRRLDLEAIEETIFLRIGARELRAVIESDAAVATSLLKSVAGHLSSAADALRDTFVENDAP